MEPSLVVEAVKENFKIDVSRQQVECYDPTKTAGADLSQELADLFHEARKKYIDQPIYNIIGANDIIQLQILSDLLVSKKGNVVIKPNPFIIASIRLNHGQSLSFPNM